MLDLAFRSILKDIFKIDRHAVIVYDSAKTFQIFKETF